MSLVFELELRRQPGPQPFLGEEAKQLFEKFKTDEPWDSPNNKPLAMQMPAAFRSPSSNAPKGYTTYRGVGGQQGVLGAPRGDKAYGTNLSEIRDGTSLTLFVLEASDELAVPWSRPDEGLDPATFDRQKIVVADFDGTVISFADGSTGFLDRSVDRKSIEHLMSKADGNVLPRDLGRSGKPEFGSLDAIKKKQFRARIDSSYLFGDDTEVMTLENMLSDSEKQELAKNLGDLEDGKFIAVMYNGAVRQFDTNKLTKEEFLKMCKIEPKMAKEKADR